jgi:hypothetical protein
MLGTPAEYNMPASHEASFFKVFFAPWPIVYFGRFF